MRFTCPKCGKKYASSAEPAPGKVYRLKCKACGEPIVITAPSAPAAPAAGAAAAVGRPSVRAAGAPAAPAPAAASPSPSTPAPRPRGSAHAERGESASADPRSAATTTATSTPAPTAAAPAPAAIPGPAATPPPPSSPPPPAVPIDLPTVTAMEIPPPPRDDAPDLKDLLGEPDREAPEETSAPGDPLAAAARASRPEGYGSAGGAPDPLAAPGREPGEAPARATAEAPRFASVGKPRAERNVTTLVLLGLGLVVLLAALAFGALRAQSPAPQRPAPGAAERANSR